MTERQAQERAYALAERIDRAYEEGADWKEIERLETEFDRHMAENRLDACSVMDLQAA